MSIANFATWKTKLSTPYQIINAGQTSSRTVNRGGNLLSGWPDNGGLATPPTTSVVCTSATVGTMGQFDSSGIMRLAKIAMANWGGANIAGFLVLCDRLVHSGGLSGTVITAQTTNLPTAALTRYTNGIGVWPMLEIWAAVGSTNTTYSMSYTNTVPTAGQTTQLDYIGGNSPAGGTFSGVSCALIPGLASGDVGVTAVASVTLTASTVSAAGNFGVVLIKPLVFIPLQNFCNPLFTTDALIGLLQPIQIQSGACLQWFLSYNSNTNFIPVGLMTLIEE